MHERDVLEGSPAKPVRLGRFTVSTYGGSPFEPEVEPGNEPEEEPQGKEHLVELKQWQCKRAMAGSGELEAENLDSSTLASGAPPRKHKASNALSRLRREAYDADMDLRLVSRLLQLAGVSSALMHVVPKEHIAAKPADAERAVRSLLRCLKLLHACSYTGEEIEVFVAHASSYLFAVVAARRVAGQAELGLQELVHTICVLMYIAHAHCHDFSCKLSHWNRYVFRQPCTCTTIMTLFETLQFSLRLGSLELLAVLSFLRSSDKEVAQEGHQIVAALKFLSGFERQQRSQPRVSGH